MLILYIDDDRDDADIFLEAISELNSSHKCLVRHDAQQALKWLLDEAVVLPEFIFLDINMPLMDGKQFLIELRKYRQFDEMRVYVFSTSINPNDVSFFSGHNVERCFTKPESFNKLTQMVGEVLM